MLAVQDSAAGRFLDGLGRELPWPKAIVVASAHFMTDGPMLGGHAQPHTVHDFGGFPQELYTLHYPAPGAPDLAESIAQRLVDAGLPVRVRESHGLDHGVWVPLLRMYPDADIPVVQISVQPALGPQHHVNLGKAVRPLADENVLIIGSGHMTHNLRDWARGQGQPAPYAREFQQWVKQKIDASQYDELVDYRSRSPHGVRAHPTDEHFLPLFFALGAAGERSKPERVYDAIDSGVLAMDAYVFS